MTGVILPASRSVRSSAIASCLVGAGRSAARSCPTKRERMGAFVLGQQYNPRTQPAPQPAAQIAIDYKPQVSTMLRANFNGDPFEDYAILSDVYENRIPTGQQQVIFMISDPKSSDGKPMRIERKILPIQYADLDSMELTGGAKPDITLTSNLERTNPSHMENNFGTLTLYNGKDFNKF
jgi:hypothetical protein